jgi:lipoprotein-anchoring transpeptidase ErfK/SrfK
VTPVSHGCIRISPDDAEWLKSWNPVGVPIQITRWSGKIAKTIADQ